MGLIDAQGKGPIVDLTNSGYDDSRPTWSADGKMMYWFSDRQGLRNHGNGGAENDVFGMFFTQAAYDRFKMTREEFDLAKHEEKDTASDKDDQKKSRRRILTGIIKPMRFLRSRSI